MKKPTIQPNHCRTESFFLSLSRCNIACIERRSCSLEVAHIFNLSEMLFVYAICWGCGSPATKPSRRKSISRAGSCVCDNLIKNLIFVCMRCKLLLNFIKFKIVGCEIYDAVNWKVEIRMVGKFLSTFLLLLLSFFYVGTYFFFSLWIIFHHLCTKQTCHNVRNEYLICSDTQMRIFINYGFHRSVFSVVLLVPRNISIWKWVSEHSMELATRKCQYQAHRTQHSNENAIPNWYYFSGILCSYVGNVSPSQPLLYQLNKWAIHAWTMDVCTWATTSLFLCTRAITADFNTTDIGIPLSLHYKDREAIFNLLYCLQRGISVTLSLMWIRYFPVERSYYSRKR